jgi:hypothetical protein
VIDKCSGVLQDKKKRYQFRTDQFRTTHSKRWLKSYAETPSKRNASSVTVFQNYDQ